MVATYLGPSIGPTQEKLLKSLIGTDGPYRVFKDAHGQVLWEKNALTLVSDTLPTGLAKKMQLWLKPILKLNLKLRVRKTTGEAEESEGEDIADNLLKRDEADSAQSAQAGEELKERFSALEPAIKQALGGPLAADVKELLGRLQRERAGGDFDEADAVLDEVESVLERGEALDAWQAECEQAVTSLKSVASAIASARHASSAKGVVEIQQVLEKLKTAPTTAQLVAELQTFVADDVVVADVSELATDIRTPMLRALAELRAHMGG
jgi:hypothetical protein